MKIRVGQALVGTQLFILYAFTFGAFIALVWTQPTSTATVPSVDVLTNPAVFLVFFGMMSIIMLIIIRRVSSKRFWHIFFGVGAFVGIYTVGVMLISRVASSAVAMIASAILAIAILAWRQHTKQMVAHHCAILLAVIGVGVILGEQFTTRSAMLVVAVLAIYDIISVYFTRHMIELAHIFFKREAWFGVIIPSNPKLWNSTFTTLQPGQDALVLGAGDIAIPLIFAAAHLYENGLDAFFIMFTSALVGVALLFYWYVHLQRGQSIPALPPIAVALFIGHWIIMRG